MSKHLCVCPKGNARISLHCIFFFFSFLKVYFIDCAITIVPFFSPRYSPLSYNLPPTSIPPPPRLRSCPWVIRISFLASPFPILFLTSPCLFCAYQLCFLFPVLFSHSPPSPSLLVTHHVISISVILLLFRLVCFCFCFFRFSY